ncbi:MAG TPA: ribonuclease D, partial [Alphaproteobacteria bacterium]
MTVHLHRYDLPAEVELGATIAVDTETAGLSLVRDRLCAVQLSAGDGDAHVVHFPTPDYDAANLKRVLADSSATKLFHFARFDLAVLSRALGVVSAPVYCTKVASRLVRTYSDRHGLKDLCQELLGIELSKQQQSSDWAAP